MSLHCNIFIYSKKLTIRTPFASISVYTVKQTALLFSFFEFFVEHRVTLLCREYLFTGKYIWNVKYIWNGCQTKDFAELLDSSFPT